MKAYDFIAIDFETANQYSDSICQIGITTVKNGKIQEVKSWLINPETFFDDYNIRIHHITPDMVKDQPSFPQLWPTISKYFGYDDIDNLIFAHNANFDIRALLSTLDRYNIPVTPGVYGCSLALSRRAWLREPSYSLSSLCQKLNIKAGNHDAGEDSRACAEIVLCVAKEKGVDFSKRIESESDLNEIEESLKVSLGYYNQDGYFSCLCKRISKKERRKNIIGDKSKNNPESIFFQKNVAFTGKLSSMVRAEAQQIIADIGGINQDGINKNTNFLIVGQQDYRIVGEDGMSAKQEKAIKLISKGQDLEILSEDDFLHSV
ncbi:exonuclease domain-containing protein [Bacteroides pyogenes]|uniref:BRCT domain-containing protein n=1 Tax=Bacteroides pyogenes TaxID=310300 RepID=A0A5D3E9Y5_9BACE|nr:exonuclease domain-containing protein [Bacteroides pyogenes]TYK32381.1 hypothetical protein FNJ60_12200 [Bacteroides pyogenes]